jgi:hypothetical protein
MKWFLINDYEMDQRTRKAYTQQNFVLYGMILVFIIYMVLVFFGASMRLVVPLTFLMPSAYLFYLAYKGIIHRVIVFQTGIGTGPSRIVTLTPHQSFIVGWVFLVLANAIVVFYLLQVRTFFMV